MEERTNIRMRLRNGIWQDAIPNFGPSFHESKFLEPLDSTWTDIWDKVKNHENTMQCINLSLSGKENDIIKPVTLLELNNFLNNLEQWVSNNENNLTFPLTKDGWKKSVYETLEKNDLETFTLLCGAFPEQIKTVVDFESMPDNKIKKWWGSFNKELDLKNNIVVSEEKSLVHADTSNPLNEVDKNSIKGETLVSEPEKAEKIEKKVFSKKPEGPYPPSQEIKESIESMNKLMKDINNSYNGSSKTLIDEYCKFHCLRKDSTEATNWFSKIFFSSFQHMEEESINFFIDNIPNWREQPVETRPLRNVNAMDVLNDIHFWSGLKFMQKKVTHAKNKEILQNFIPSMLDISSLSVSNKIEIGKNMLKFAKSSEDAFRNKLMMWTAMGGSLTEHKKEPTSDVFQSRKGTTPESLIKWILEEKNPKWDNVVIEYAKEKNLNLYKWYPNDFKSDDLFEIYESSSPVSKPTF